jgi:hypothetical protein
MPTFPALITHRLSGLLSGVDLHQFIEYRAKSGAIRNDQNLLLGLPTRPVSSFGPVLANNGKRQRYEECN